ncbi:formyltetrahydrofolate deformylase [Solicola gregarius]|uniref:Formyltetrahydrofolate deformylase n=1 Tax=Solicola gregarius TaxID=2908642 RepID=A0AA46YLK7_9ACTN|nr:formyltetrahydrofolate deformylase [Solicola gregarius]UYM07050.1 formyltetrahydrofolate deformylase [Solicola gregarius]
MSEAPERKGYVLTLSCPDVPGIVFAVSKHFMDEGFNIFASQQFLDEAADRFFMRVHVHDARDRELTVDEVRAAFASVGTRFGMTWLLQDAGYRSRVLLLVSRFGHCLNDLLFRTSIGQLNVDIPAIVSNHPDFAPLAANYGIPFHHVPVTSDTKAQAEDRLRQVIADERIDLVVLARYMQILSPQLCDDLAGRAINIHHSMLPSFKGARPYHQAHARGVKLVGATAHYVTANLDEGPIIEQEIARVDHSMSPTQLVDVGHDVERLALQRAVRWHTENRVLLNGSRTVVFR